MDLTPLFEKAAASKNSNRSAGLGNRKTYIGSSDVGSCARKV